jgi:hypothetical protein
MQIENDYDKEVYNGDISYIDDVDPEAGELAVSFDGRWCRPIASRVAITDKYDRLALMV